MRWISTVAGLIATAAALLVLTSISPATVEQDAPPEAQPEPTTTLLEPSPSTVTVTITVPEVPVSGLDSSVSDALIDSGYTEFISETDLGSELSPEIARVLTKEEVVLVVADEGDG